MENKYYTKIGIADEQLEVPFDGTIYTRCQNCGKEVKVSVRRGHHMESEFCDSCKALL